MNEDFGGTVSDFPDREPGFRREAKLRDAVFAMADAASDPDAGDELAFGAKCLVSASLPYRNPPASRLVNGAWIRRNGDYTLWIQGGPQGIPYGTYPRLFIIWLTSEAIRTGSNRLSTGGTFKEFCRKLNIDHSRGKRGQGRALIEQADRLLSSRAAFITGDVPIEKLNRKHVNFLQFSDGYSLFLDESADDRQQSLFQSEIILTDKFFNEITTHCIPLDLQAVRALQQAPLELDIYQWLAYRMFTLRSPARPTWQQLHMQFGSGYARMRDFRAGFLESLATVKRVYEQVRVEHSETGLVLFPSPTPVAGPRLHVVGA